MPAPSFSRPASLPSHVQIVQQALHDAAPAPRARGMCPSQVSQIHLRHVRPDLLQKTRPEETSAETRTRGRAKGESWMAAGWIGGCT